MKKVQEMTKEEFERNCKNYSVYLAPKSEWGGICGSSHWEILSSPEIDTREGLLTYEEAEQYVTERESNYAKKGVLIIKDRREFDVLPLLIVPEFPESYDGINLDDFPLTISGKNFKGKKYTRNFKKEDVKKWFDLEEHVRRTTYKAISSNPDFKNYPNTIILDISGIVDRCIAELKGYEEYGYLYFRLQNNNFTSWRDRLLDIARDERDKYMQEFNS
jgi:hypothetical protein